MKILIYCYGPASIEKDLFCKQFAEENSNYSLISSYKIKQKASKVKVSKKEDIELLTKQVIISECAKVLNKKNKNVILNCSLFNKQSRLSLINELEKIIDFKIKKAAIAFLPQNAEENFNNLKKYEEYSDIDFKYLSNQFTGFKFAENQEEADILISNIENYSKKFHLETKLWGKEEKIVCNSLKKISEYIQFTNSFNQ